MSTVSSAIAAYSAAAKGVTGEAPTPEEPEGPSFGSVLMDAAKSAVDTGRKAEHLSAAAIAGKADVRDVVQAVNNAEMTLNTVVAVRDKVIGAYNEILKMPI